MGIIISSFLGCGKTFLTNTYGDKVKILDATGFNKESMVDEVMGQVDKYDIVFIPSDNETRSMFNDRKIDYDVFYPSSDRRNEFIENQVRKRSKPDVIRAFDNDFGKMVSEIDNSEAENCYKHKLSNFGEFIGNNNMIMQYINSLKPAKNNEQG